MWCRRVHETVDRPLDACMCRDAFAPPYERPTATHRSASIACEIVRRSSEQVHDSRRAPHSGKCRAEFCASHPIAEQESDTNRPTESVQWSLAAIQPVPMMHPTYGNYLCSPLCPSSNRCSVYFGMDSVSWPVYRFLVVTIAAPRLRCAHYDRRTFDSPASHYSRPFGTTAPDNCQYCKCTFVNCKSTWAQRSIRSSIVCLFLPTYLVFLCNWMRSENSNISHKIVRTNTTRPKMTLTITSYWLMFSGIWHWSSVFSAK